VTAGRAAKRAVGAGQALAVTTGAPLPEGADAVVPVEVTEAASGTKGAETAVRLTAGVREGENVSRRAEQAAKGDVVARAGTRIEPATVGVLAAAGRAFVSVAVPPRVAIVGTGDELVAAATSPGPSQVRDSNGHALLAQALRAGATGEYGGPVPDDPDALAAAVRRGFEADVLCLSGGVSMGERDLVPGILDAEGVERMFHRWGVKPGGPLWAGKRGSTLVFGLPGNPAASFVGFEVLVVPVIRARLGMPFGARETLRVVFDGTTGKPIARRQYLPVSLASGPEAPTLRARPVRWTGSGDPFGLAAADALAVVPEGTTIAKGGETVLDAIPLTGSTTSALGRATA
jgi:molybdopterin molybdotransferase